MITDAIMGVMIFGDASIRHGGLNSIQKERFLRELNAMRDMKDESFENFEVAVRSAYKDFLSAYPDTQVGKWVAEAVVTLKNKDENNEENVLIVNFNRPR